VFGFLTARYLSTARLDTLRIDAVHEMKYTMYIANDSSAPTPLISKPSLM
jgi:1,4-alpha-glucan branching enzyme